MSIPINPLQKPKNEKLEKIKKWFKKHQERIILTLGAILIAALAFLAGRLYTKPLSTDTDLDKKSLKGQVEIPIKKEIQEQREKSLNIDENISETREDAENTEE